MLDLGTQCLSNWTKEQTSYHSVRNKDLPTTMKTLIFLILLGIHGAAAVTHSMTYIVTAVSGLDGFPEHNEVGLVNGQEFVHYDSYLKKIIPKTDWIEKNEGADYWERETQRNINTEQVFKSNIGIAMQRFNQTGGVHIFQTMYGCEWDDETGEVKGNHQFGYDGDDFVALDLKTETWTAPTPEAVITKHKWDNNRALIAVEKNYFTQECVEWLKKYLNYGRSSLLRTALPSVSLLQKTPSSPVSCHATGFYPDRAVMFWRKDGGDLHDGVEKGEILPNHDGTFQMSVELKSPAPGQKYECVFQLSGVKHDIIKRLDKAEIRTNWKTSSDVTVPIIAAVVVVALVLIAVIGFVVYKRKNIERSGKSEKSTQQNSDTSSCSSDDSAKESDKALIKDPDTLSFKSDSSSGESAGSNTPLMKR